MIITKSMVNEYVVTGEFDIAASVSPDADSAESKKVTLRFKFDGVNLSEIIQSSLKDKRINWQSSARKQFALISAGAIVSVDYRGGRTPVDPITEYKNRFANASAEERAKMLAELQALAK